MSYVLQSPTSREANSGSVGERPRPEPQAGAPSRSAFAPAVPASGRGQRQESTYRSPLREAQAAATRDRILDAVATLFERGDDPTYGAIAAVAAVQERTVYRHFPSKDDLYRAFWCRVHEQRIGVGRASTSSPSRRLPWPGALFALALRAVCCPGPAVLTSPRLERPR